MTVPPDRLSAVLADRYRLDRELGAGGMATVYLARDVKHDRDVAIKVLRPELAAVIGAQRFLTEIKTTANLQHPHILPLHDSGEVDGTVYYVMPFVEGESLRDRLNREKQLPVSDAVRIATEVAGALDYAHRHGVIHRDIKPENILLHDGAAMVADFGIALAVSRSDGGTRLTETGMSLGTPHYMSPEQAMGERDLDARTDVYALGAVTYEMLAGEPPFTGPTAQAIVAKVVTATPEPLTTYRKLVPPAIEDAVHTALQKLPADRFASAREFGTALEGKTGRTVRSSREARGSGRQAGWNATLRNPAVWGLAVLALAASAFGFREWKASRIAAPSSVIRFFVDVPTGYTASASGSQGPDIAISPDGSTLAFPVTGPDGARQLFVRTMDEPQGRLLPGTDGAYSPAFSADGSALVFWAAGRFQRVALSGGTPQFVAEPGTDQSHAVLPGGDVVVAMRTGGALRRLSVSGGDAAFLAPLDTARGEVSQFYPLALSNGTHVLYTSWGNGGVEDAHIGLLDLARGVARRLEVPGTYALGVLNDRLIYADLAGTIFAIPFDLGAGRSTGESVPLVTGVAQGARGTVVAKLAAAGTLVYLSGSQMSTLVLADSAGEKPVLAEAGRYGFPRYSPDGKRVALTIASGTSTDIWLADVASRGLTRLTGGGSVNERPEWSPDGSRVLFRTVRGDRSALWWQLADGSGPATPLLSADDADYFEGVITPDGRNVVYQVDSGESNVMMQSVDGSSPPVAVANSPDGESQARVSPDGRWVAYVAGGIGGAQVFVQPLSGPGSRVQVSVRGGGEPVWSRDGRRIFYRADGKFVMADVSTTPTLRVSSRVDFMNDGYLPNSAPHANYDVSPDGTKLLVLKGEPQRLLVVHNWGAAVKAQLSEGAGRGPDR